MFMLINYQRITNENKAPLYPFLLANMKQAKNIQGWWGVYHNLGVNIL